MKTQRRRGFTVVELVVVIAIIAVLAAVLIPTFTSIIKKANDSAYLQERTNQQIADLAEKVEKINYFTWEDFEKKLAEELAKVGSTDTEAIQKAVDAAIAKYSDSSQTGNTGLTETQVKKIVEEAMKGQLTTAQVEAIVRQVLSGTTVSEETIRTIVNNAVKGMSTTGVTKAQVADAVKAAISGTIAVNGEQLEAAVKKALEAFGVSTITDQQVEDIVSNLKNVIMINDEPGFSAATDTGSYAINEDDANKVYYLVTEVALESFTITGSTDETTIIIDAPNIKDVTIEGNAKVLRVLRTADESTHIKGTVTTLEVNSGRVVIEAGATVGTIKAAPAKQATVTIVLENGSKVTDLNSEFQYYAGTNDYIKIIDNGATVGNSFITSSSAVTTSTTTNVVLSGSAFVDTTTDTLKVKNESGVDAQIKVIDAENNETTYTTNGQSSNLTLFAGGSGTEADPWIVTNADQIRNIGNHSTDSENHYWKVKDGITEIDCNNWVSVDIKGSFDGNNVTFNNLSATLFGTVSSQTGKENTIKNFTVNAQVILDDWNSVVVYYNAAKNTTYENITVHGYLEGATGVATYIQFGSTNAVINFKNCESDLTIVATSGCACGFIAHPYGATSVNLINSHYNGSMSTVYDSHNNNCYVNGNYFTGVTFDEASQRSDVQWDGGYNGHYHYLAEGKTSNLTTKTGTLPENIGDVIVTTAEAGASRAIISIIISPNDVNETGCYTQTFITEAAIKNGSFSSDDIKYFNVRVNPDGITESGIHGNNFDIVGDRWGHTLGGNTFVKVTQYDTLGNVICVTTYNFNDAD